MLESTRTTGTGLPSLVWLTRNSRNQDPGLHIFTCETLKLIMSFPLLTLLLCSDLQPTSTTSLKSVLRSGVSRGTVGCRLSGWHTVRVRPRHHSSQPLELLVMWTVCPVHLFICPLLLCYTSHSLSLYIPHSVCRPCRLGPTPQSPSRVPFSGRRTTLGQPSIKFFILLTGSNFTGVCLTFHCFDRGNRLLY